MPVFPPGDAIRDLSLLLMGGVVLYSILMSTLLYRDWYSNQYRKMVDIQFAWATFLLGMALNRGAFIFSDFYFVVEPYSTLFIKIGYVGLILALSAFFFSIELIIPYDTGNAFFIIGMIHAIFAIIFPRVWLDGVAVSIALVTLAGVMLFLNYTMKNTSGNVRKSTKTIIAGFLIGFLGFVFSSDIIYNILGMGPYLLGEGALVIGLVIFGFGAIYSPALSELDWRQQLVEIYVMQHGGLLVYHYEFERTSELDQVLTAAGMSGVQSLFQEITQSDLGLNVVSVGKYEILFSHSTSFTSVLITKAPYNVLVDKIEQFTNTFEIMFGSIIQNFEGSLSEFSSAKELVDSIFF
ncbi:MAG: hypothetical protein ACW98U_02890 [Candidatus Thorarchaeota archaeon]|jgi:hypothetical protein